MIYNSGKHLLLTDVVNRKAKTGGGIQIKIGGAFEKAFKKY